MFKVSTNIDSIEKINKHLNLAKSIQNMKNDKEFQQYIQSKAMQTLEDVMNARLVGGTTNDDSITLYKNSNYIQILEDGFIIYNNAKIPANVKGVQNDISNYPNGEFSIALAFEYGVGIIGISTDNPKSWEKNVNNYNFGWYLPKEVFGETGIQTAGYKGFEIYRYTAIEIQKQLPKWVNDYYRGKLNG